MDKIGRAGANLKKSWKKNIVLHYFIDPNQELYSRIYGELNLLYKDNTEQFKTMMDSDEFKEACARYRVGTVGNYQLDKLLFRRCIKKIDFLIVVKSVKTCASERSSVS